MDGYWQDGKYILVSTLQSKYDAEQAKVKKLEGWLKLLYYHHCDDRETDKALQEIFDHIKAMEVGE